MFKFKRDSEPKLLKNMLICILEGLTHNLSSNELVNKVKMGLGNYAMQVHKSDFLNPEEKETHLRELIHCLDKDNLSPEQFFDEVLSLKSSDKVRHVLKPILAMIRSGNSDEVPEPTFEHQYPEKTKRSIPPEKILKKREFMIDDFVSNVLNKILEDENCDIDIVERNPQTVVYVHSDYPNEERDLFEDVTAILNGNAEDVNDIPKGVQLSLLYLLCSALAEDSRRYNMPEEMQDNLKSLCSDYEMFGNFFY